MGSMAYSANPTLSGHKVLILLQYEPDEEFISRVKVRHPDLEVDWQNTSFEAPVLKKGIWDGVTAVCTWNSIPTPEQTPKLRLVQLTSSGANHCDETEVYKNPEVKFCTSNGIHPPQITEWVFATFLSFQHHLPRYAEAMKEGIWLKAPATDVEDSVGLRIGILGYGAIGRQCARVAKAFGMDVVVYTMRERSTTESKRDDSYNIPGTGDPDGLLPSQWFSGSSKESLHDFLAQDLDLLVICLPLTTSTTGLISKEQFQILSKRKTFVSNIGRGPIINTPDFIEALERGLIRGAAVDVTDPEPLPKDHALWKAKNLFISPHISWHSTDHAKRLLGVLELNLERLAEGKPLVNEVDRGLGY